MILVMKGDDLVAATHVNYAFDDFQSERLVESGCESLPF